ncbi:RNI-like protein, partial [Stereum hirsutum FP-91666 SS1]
WNTPMVEFKRGVVYEDGRLDLCKMVVGPTHVEKLLDSLENNTMITQFLLGNNVSSTTGARRIAKFIADHPGRIETWYLAGNHIRPPSFKLLVDSMICSSRITNIWLKRNPLTSASVFDIHRLITNTPNLRTLDLENTELGDVGVNQLFSQLTGKEVPLRNLYLNSNGIGVNASKSLASFLAHPSCKLESLYLSSNPIGDAGATHLAAALKSNTSLIRIAFCSAGLTSRGIADLSYALSNHPSIRALMLAASMTTEAHRQRFNHIADSAIPALVALMSNPSMQFLTLGRVAFSVDGWETVKTAVEDTNICDLVAHRLHAPGEAPECSLTLRKALAANVKRLYPKEENYETFASGMGARSL